MNSKLVTLAMMITTTFLVTHLHASDLDYSSAMIKHNTIKKVEVYEVTTDLMNQNPRILMQTTEIPGNNQDFNNYYFPDKYGQLNPTETGPGKVIATARELVALGEDVYRLVIKGKPTNTLTYIPVSVIPKQGGAAVDIFETENWKAPKKRTFYIVYTNYFNIDVVKFQYSVLYSYGGTYGGKGAYITGAQIVPESVSTLFGYDFTATMKVGGIQNNNTREDPVAGATLLLEHNVSTVVKTMTQVDNFFITGKGGFKKL